MDNGITAQNGNVIVINDLVKQFDDITAVNGLNLEIREWVGTVNQENKR
jgi:Neuraminidase (sialidase)